MNLERLADEADEAELRIRTKAHRELNGLIADLRDARPGAEAGRLEHEARAYILKLLEKEAARECARRVIPTLDAILDFVIGFGLLALAMLGVAAACVAAGAPDGITRTAALLGVGFITALSLHRLGRK